MDGYQHALFLGGWPGFHSPLLWCLRFADILEPNRNWSSVRSFRENLAQLRATAFAGRWEEGALLHCTCIIEMFIDTGFPIHPNIYSSHREMSRRLNLDASGLP